MIMERRSADVLGQKREGWPEPAHPAFRRFRDSKLYAQLVCTAVLVAVGGLFRILPEDPWQRVTDGLRWVVTADYDFKGKAAEVGQWAERRGGWAQVAPSLWRQGVELARERLGLGATDQAPGPVSPVSPGPSVSAPGAPSSSAPDNSVTDSDASDPGAPVPDSPTPAEAVSGANPSPLQPVEGTILWEYGWLPQGVGESFHEGIDFLAQAGTPVVAILDGTVVAIRPETPHGRLVEVRHGPMIAVYAQVEGVQVRAGDEVMRGQTIAKVARARGVEESLSPHLHFEVRPAQNGEPIDPAPYLGLGGNDT